MNSNSELYSMRAHRVFNLKKVSWRYIKKIYVLYDTGNDSSLKFHIFESSGTDNEYVVLQYGYNTFKIGIRLISLLKYSGSNIKKETLINLLSTWDGVKLVKQMVADHFIDAIKQLDLVHNAKSPSPGFYNFPDNREKWMRKNIIFQNIN